MSNIIFDDDMFMDFTDTLFSSLSTNQPFAFPNPREIGEWSDKCGGGYPLIIDLDL